MSKYDSSRADFSWSEESRLIYQSGNYNIATVAVDRHTGGELASKRALHWLGKKGNSRSYTYSELSSESNRFANALRSLGLETGESVFFFTGRIPELYIAAYGALKNGNIISPLFSAFGPEPLRMRLERGEAKALITTPSLYRKKVALIRKSLPSLRHILLVESTEEESSLPAGTLSFEALLKQAESDFQVVETSTETPALLHFTSGTTGTPKGALHVHGAALHHYVSAKYALDLHAEDIFWCTADPGWVTGTSYGIIAPFVIGATSIIDEGSFDAARWYQTLHDESVTVWYTAPTAVRMLMKAGLELSRERPLPALRFIASVGEPLNPEAVRWGEQAFGIPIHDNWWQTETGGIMIANSPSMPIKPGSMGKPLPGIEAAIVEKRDDGGLCVIEEPGREGELALKTGWPSMFRSYLHDEQRYAKCFTGQYYLSGDLASRDEDGYYWFVGRADDVIKSAGHLIGPFEVESVLIEHEAVAEAAVIGKPDPITLESVTAFVSLHDGFKPTEELRKELLGFCRKKLGAAVAPKEMKFVADLPKTRSGKIMRRLLKARELGLPEGDLSTLEGAP